MTKKLFALLVVVAMIFSLGACAKTAAPAAETTADAPKESTSSGEVATVEETTIEGEDEFDAVAEIAKIEGLEDGYQVAFLVKTLTNPFFVAMQEGVKEAVRDVDTWQTYECQNDASVMLTQAENIVSSGYDVCLLTMINSSDVSILQQLSDAGCLVVLLDTLCTDDGFSYITASVCTDNYAAGYACGEAFCDLLTEKYGEPKGTCVIFENTQGTVTVERINGFEDACKDLGTVEVLYRENGKGQIDAGLEFMEKVLNLYTAEDLDGVMSMNDPSAQGCASAIKSAGYKPGDIMVFGVDGSDESIAMIKEGYQTGTSLQYPGTMATRGLYMAYKVLAGGTLSDDEKFLQISTTYINSDNCDDYSAFSYIGK